MRTNVQLSAWPYCPTTSWAVLRAPTCRAAAGRQGGLALPLRSEAGAGCRGVRRRPVLSRSLVMSPPMFPSAPVLSPSLANGDKGRLRWSRWPSLAAVLLLSFLSLSDFSATDTAFCCQPPPYPTWWQAYSPAVLTAEAAHEMPSVSP